VLDDPLEPELELELGAAADPFELPEVLEPELPDPVFEPPPEFAATTWTVPCMNEWRLQT